MFLALWGCLAQGPVEASASRKTEVGGVLALVVALKTARPGDVILLAPGNYGTVTIAGVNISGRVTIASQNEANPAVINYLNLKNSSGIVFSKVQFSARPASVSAQVDMSKNITFDSVEFRGLTDLTKTGSGLTVRNSQDVTVTKSEFHDLRGGITHINADGLTVSENKFHHIRSDGVMGTRSDNVLITKNTFTDFFPSGGVHPDAVQMWTAPDATTKNITITDNTITRGDGGISQGIFIVKGGGLGYENVKISGNALVGTMYHGITLNHATGAEVSDNLVLGYSDMTSRITIQSSTNVVQSGNQATAYVTSANTGLVATANSTIKQPAAGDLSALQRWRKGRERGPAGRAGS